jgi:hypothetical protein
VYAEVVLGKIAATSPDLLSLNGTPKDATNACTDCTPIGLSADQPDSDPVVLLGPVQTKKVAGIVDVANDDIGASVVVEVPERTSSAGFRCGDRRT